MDNNKLLAALEESEERLAEALRDKGTDVKDIGLILETLAHVRGLADAIARRGDPYRGIVYDIRNNEVVDDPDAFVAEVSAKYEEMHNPGNTETEEPAAPANTEPEPIPEPEPESEIKPCPKPEPRLTKQDMIERLTYYANEKNVQVGEIMADMGFKNLSAIPESKYAEVLEAVKKAAGEA